MEDAIARRRVVRLLDPVRLRERAADARLPLVVFAAREDEVIVGDCRLARIDGVASGDLVEGVDGERRGAVGRRQQIGVDAQRRARSAAWLRCGPRREEVAGPAVEAGELGSIVGGVREDEQRRGEPRGSRPP